MRRLVLVLLLIAAVPVAAVTPCPTLHPNINVFIGWQGETSGCSLSNATPCIPYEVISFYAGTFGYSFDCAVHSFQWSFGEGTTATSRVVQHVYAGSGVYNVRLTITNHQGSMTLQNDLRVAYIDEPWPFFAERLRNSRVYRFTIAAAAGEGDWVWDFGDGTVVTGPERERTHGYKTGGNFEIRLTSVGRPDLVYHSAVSVPYPRRRSSRH